MQKSFYVFFLIFSLLLSGCAQLPQPDFILIPDEPPPERPLRNVRVALVLSGGGARALAHAGVIEVLEKNHIPIDLIVGSSSGSIVGALYADEPNALKLKDKMIDLNKWDMLSLNWSSSIQMLWSLRGLDDGRALKLYLQDNLYAHQFSELKIPLAVVTTDVTQGKAFVLRSGPVIPALHASSAIPFLFSPVHLYGKTLVDGGIASPVPVEIARDFSPKLVIAVDIGTKPDIGSVDNNFQIATRCLHISYFNLANSQTKHADVLIHPEVDDYSMFEDNANRQIYEAGRRAALRALPRIKEALKKRPA